MDEPQRQGLSAAHRDSDLRMGKEFDLIHSAACYGTAMREWLLASSKRGASTAATPLISDAPSGARISEK